MIEEPEHERDEPWAIGDAQLEDDRSVLVTFDHGLFPDMADSPGCLLSRSMSKQRPYLVDLTELPGLGLARELQPLAVLEDLIGDDDGALDAVEAVVALGLTPSVEAG